MFSEGDTQGFFKTCVFGPVDARHGPSISGLTRADFHHELEADGEADGIVPGFIIEGSELPGLPCEVVKQILSGSDLCGLRYFTRSRRPP